MRAGKVSHTRRAPLAAATRAALYQAFPADEDWGPGAVLDVARRALPRDAVATVDTGAHRILLNQMWECYGPRTLLQSTGLCTMGCALPLAMGVKLAAPVRSRRRLEERAVGGTPDVPTHLPPSV